MRVQARCLSLTLALGCCAAPVMAQQAVASHPPATQRGAVAAPAPLLPPGYVIGADDVLSIKFWKDVDMSTDSAMVRPDGKISLPLLNEVQAAGLTPEQLRAKLTEAAAK